MHMYQDYRGITDTGQCTCIKITVGLLVVSSDCTLTDGSFIMSSDMESRRLPVLAVLLPNMDLKMQEFGTTQCDGRMLSANLEKGCIKLLARPPVPTGDCRRANPSLVWVSGVHGNINKCKPSTNKRDSHDW